MHAPNRFTSLPGLALRTDDLGAALRQRREQAVILAGAQRLEELRGVEQQQRVACSNGTRAGATMTVTMGQCSSSGGRLQEGLSQGRSLARPAGTYAR